MDELGDTQQSHERREYLKKYDTFSPNIEKKTVSEMLEPMENMQEYEWWRLMWVI